MLLWGGGQISIFSSVGLVYLLFVHRGLRKLFLYNGCTQFTYEVAQSWYIGLHVFIEHKMCTYCGTQLRWLSKLCFSAIVHWRRCTAVSCSWSSSCRRLTTAKHGLFTTDSELKAVKDNSGVAQCVTSLPNKTVTTRSKIDCMRVCITEGCSAQLHLLSGSYLVCVQRDASCLSVVSFTKPTAQFFYYQLLRFQM